MILWAKLIDFVCTTICLNVVHELAIFWFVVVYHIIETYFKDCGTYLMGMVVETQPVPTSLDYFCLLDIFDMLIV